MSPLTKTKKKTHENKGSWRLKSKENKIIFSKRDCSMRTVTVIGNSAKSLLQIS